MSHFEIFSFRKPGPEVIIFFMLNSACMKFFLLINVKMPTNVGSVTCMSRKQRILGLFEPKKSDFLIFLYISEFKSLCSAELSMKNFITSGLVCSPLRFKYFGIEMLNTVVGS